MNFSENETVMKVTVIAIGLVIAGTMCCHSARVTGEEHDSIETEDGDQEDFAAQLLKHLPEENGATVSLFGGEPKDCSCAVAVPPFNRAPRPPVRPLPPQIPPPPEQHI